MKMDSYWRESRVLNSVEAEAGARRMLKKLEEGNLAMEVLPNKFAKFSGKLEESDYISYYNFLESSNGKKILTMLEEEDARKFIEL